MTHSLWASITILVQRWSKNKQIHRTQLINWNKCNQLKYNLIVVWGFKSTIAYNGRTKHTLNHSNPNWNEIFTFLWFKSVAASKSSQFSSWFSVMTHDLRFFFVFLSLRYSEFRSMKTNFEEESANPKKKIVFVFHTVFFFFFKCNFFSLLGLFKSVNNAIDMRAHIKS